MAHGLHLLSEQPTTDDIWCETSQPPQHNVIINTIWLTIKFQFQIYLILTSHCGNKNWGWGSKMGRGQDPPPNNKYITNDSNIHDQCSEPNTENRSINRLEYRTEYQSEPDTGIRLTNRVEHQHIITIPLKSPEVLNQAQIIDQLTESSTKHITLQQTWPEFTTPITDLLTELTAAN